MRAEIIAIARLSESESSQPQVEEHRQAALAEEQQIQTLIAEYKETYSAELIRHGEVEYSLEALDRLGTWRL